MKNTKRYRIQLKACSHACAIMLFSALIFVNAPATGAQIRLAQLPASQGSGEAERLQVDRDRIRAEVESLNAEIEEKKKQAASEREKAFEAMRQKIVALKIEQEEQKTTRKADRKKAVKILIQEVLKLKSEQEKIEAQRKSTSTRAWARVHEDVRRGAQEKGTLGEEKDREGAAESKTRLKILKQEIDALKTNFELAEKKLEAERKRALDRLVQDALSVKAKSKKQDGQGFFNLRVRQEDKSETKLVFRNGRVRKVPVN